MIRLTVRLPAPPDTRYASSAAAGLVGQHTTLRVGEFAVTADATIIDASVVDDDLGHGMLVTIEEAA